MSTILAVLFACLPLLLFGSLPSACPGNTTALELVAGVDLKGKLALITGGDVGIGRATAAALLGRGARVVIAGRSEAKGLAAARELGGDTTWRYVDLASLQTVRDFADWFVREHGHTLHILINNAGIDHPSYMTADGFESVFEIDYLGHFLLTELLLPSLRATDDSRVVNVASGSHASACSDAGWPDNCFAKWNYLPPPLVSGTAPVHMAGKVLQEPASSYGVAKFAQIQHAAALARREEDVVAISLTPGFALTSMTRYMDPEYVALICRDQASVGYACPFTAEQDAAVVAFGAVAAVESGLYYNRGYDCAAVSPHMQGFTSAMQDELYRRSLTWVGLRPSDDVVVAFV